MSKKDGESKFVIVDSNTDFPHESILIEWLFHKIGENGVFTLSDLSAYTKVKGNHSTYSSDFAKWIQAVKEEVKQSHLVEKKKRLKMDNRYSQSVNNAFCDHTRCSFAFYVDVFLDHLSIRVVALCDHLST